RQVADIGDAADIGQYVVQVRDPEVGQAERGGGDAAAREVDRLVAGAPGQQGVIGADGAGDLQRFFGFDRLAECFSGAHLFAEQVFDPVPLRVQLLQRRVHALAAEVAHVDALDDLVPDALAGHRV